MTSISRCIALLRIKRREKEEEKTKTWQEGAEGGRRKSYHFHLSQSQVTCSTPDMFDLWNLLSAINWVCRQTSRETSCINTDRKLPLPPGHRRCRETDWISILIYLYSCATRCLMHFIIRTVISLTISATAVMVIYCRCCILAACSQLHTSHNAPPPRPGHTAFPDWWRPQRCWRGGAPGGRRHDRTAWCSAAAAPCT